MKATSAAIRASWLAARKARGKARPFEVDAEITNLVGVTRGPAAALKILQNVAVRRPDIIGAVEALDLRKPHLDGYEVWQDTSTDLAKRGCLLAVRRGKGRILWAKLVKATPARAGLIRERYLIVARVVFDEGTPQEWRPRVVVGHAPNKKNWVLSPLWFARFRATRPHIGLADFNRLREYVERNTGMTARAHHVMAVVVREWLPSSLAKTRRVGSDHLDVNTTLWRNS